MPRLGGRGLDLVLILSKYLLTNSRFFWKCEHHLTRGILFHSLRLPNCNTINFPDGAATHQFIGYNPSPSAWSLCSPLHTQNGLHDRTNKGASFVIVPLSTADIFWGRHLQGIRWTCHDNGTNSPYRSIVISLLYGSMSILWILLKCVSAGMPDFSNYLIQQHHSLLRLSSREHGV